MPQLSTTICGMKQLDNMTYSINSKVFSAIVGHGRGWVFTPAHFSRLGSRTAVASALTHLKRKGTIRQLTWGLYDYPRNDKQLGLLAPTIDAIAAALQIRDAVRLQPSGAYAANLLGLSTQIPVKVVFLTDGPSRKIQLGKQIIILKRTTPRNMATAGKISGLVIQALRHLGQRHVDANIEALLKNRLNSKDKKNLAKHIRYAPTWIREVIRRLTAEQGASS